MGEEEFTLLGRGIKLPSGSTPIGRPTIIFNPEYNMYVDFRHIARDHLRGLQGQMNLEGKYSSANAFVLGEALESREGYRFPIQFYRI